MNKNDFIAICGLIALFCLFAWLIAGCYIGQAEFRGEDMRVYPFFSAEKVSSNE